MEGSNGSGPGLSVWRIFKKRADQMLGWTFKNRERIAFRAPAERKWVKKAVSCEEPGMSEDVFKSLEFKPEYKGQLGPAKPDPSGATSATVTGPVFRCSSSSVTLQSGPFNSLWLRVQDKTLQSPFSDVANYWCRKHLQKWEKSLPGAPFYIAVAETSGALPEVLQWCRAHDMAFHHYRSALPGQGPAEFVYYKWHGPPGSKDLVPPYATAVQGVGAIILSPDEREVLLVWEYGCWKMVTGAIDLGEDMFIATERECAEEVGIALDPAFQPQCLGGWQKSKARDRQVSDNFFVFAVRAMSKDVQVDGVEVSSARWFPVEALLAIEKPQEPHQHVQACVGSDVKPISISTSLLIFLSSFSSGKGLRVTRLPQFTWFGG